LSVVVIQIVFIAFLVVYARLIVSNFYQYPFTKQSEVVGLEITILLYVTGIAFEEMLQVGSITLLFVIYFH